MLVCVNFRSDADSARSIVEQIKSSGGDAFALQADVGVTEEIQKLFEQLDAELTKKRGDRGFDILVNNAGIGGGGPFATSTEADFDKVFATNVKGVFFTTQHALPRIKDGGRIINVSSNLSKHPMAMMLAYCMTKAAINNFTEGLAAEVGKRGITVNTLAPGLTETDLTAQLRGSPFERAVAESTALGRVGLAQDIASAAALLASPDSGWITGQYVEASGGLGLVPPRIG